LSATSQEKKSGRISALALDVDRIEQYWCSLLKLLVSVLKFASEKGLTLRGDDELIESSHDANYLKMLELLAEYDQFLR